MYLKAYGKGIFKIAAGVAAAAFTALMIVYAENGREGAANGIRLCLNALVPSLFPFMAAVKLLISTGFCASAGKLLNKPSRLLFGLGGSFAPVFMLSLIGGYPVGAAGIRSLYSRGELSIEEAKRAALFSVGAGPGFLISFVGLGVYSNAKTGVYLLIAQSTAAVLLGAGSRFLCRGEFDISNKEIKSASLPFSQAVTEAVYSASKAMAVTIGFVVVFCSANAVLCGAVKSGFLRDALTLTLEVCGGVSELSGKLGLDAAAFAIGFGGICVHFQIFAALGEVRVNKALFFVFRILQGLLTALFTRIIITAFPVPAQVFSTQSRAPGTVYGGSVFSGAMLVAVAVCFLISVKNLNKSHSLFRR